MCLSVRCMMINAEDNGAYITWVHLTASFSDHHNMMTKLSTVSSLPAPRVAANGARWKRKATLCVHGCSFVVEHVLSVVDVHLNVVRSRWVRTHLVLKM
jgi:hypothetical protein